MLSQIICNSIKLPVGYPSQVRKSNEFDISEVKLVLEHLSKVHCDSIQGFKRAERKVCVDCCI